MKLLFNFCFLLNFIFKNVLLLNPLSSLRMFKINDSNNNIFNSKEELITDKFKIEVTFNSNEKISLIPSMNSPFIILFNNSNKNEHFNNTSGNIILNENTSISFSFYKSKFGIFEDSKDIIYAVKNNSDMKIGDYYENCNGILGLAHHKNISNYAQNLDSIQGINDSFVQFNFSYIIFEPYYNINKTKKDNYNISIKENKEQINFTHGFDIKKGYPGWAIGLVAIFFGNKSDISRDGKRAQTDNKYLVFEEGFEHNMIMDNETGDSIMKLYEKEKEKGKYWCNKSEPEGSNYFYLTCDQQYDMVLQIEDYGYNISKSLIWDKNTLKINFLKTKSDYIYIYPNIHGLFYRKYSKENNDSYKIFLEPINKDDIIDLSGIWKIIFIIIVLLVVIIITIFVMRMMKKDSNESVDYNNMQQI